MRSAIPLQNFPVSVAFHPAFFCLSGIVPYPITPNPLPFYLAFGAHNLYATFRQYISLFRSWKYFDFEPRELFEVARLLFKAVFHFC
jgi:hypothetical protein